MHSNVMNHYKGEAVTSEAGFRYKRRCQRYKKRIVALQMGGAYAWLAAARNKDGSANNGHDGAYIVIGGMAIGEVLYCVSLSTLGQDFIVHPPIVCDIMLQFDFLDWSVGWRC